MNMDKIARDIVSLLNRGLPIWDDIDIDLDDEDELVEEIVDALYNDPKSVLDSLQDTFYIFENDLDLTSEIADLATIIRQLKRTMTESRNRKNKRRLVIEDVEDNIKDEFLYAFLLDRMTVFEVDFYTLGNNSHPYFSTSAARFSRNKRDYTSAGQAQERLLYGKAKKFYEKWDHLHLKDLTDEEYDEIVRDIDELKRAYPYHIAYEFNGKATRTTIPFYEIYKKSMEVPRKR